MPDFHAKLTLDAATLRLSDIAFENEVEAHLGYVCDELRSKANAWRHAPAVASDLEARRHDWLHNHVGEPLPADLRDA